MADGLSVAASILQVISTGVQVSLYLYTFVENVSSAGKAIKEISTDISFTTNVLEALSAAGDLVRECSKAFEGIQALIMKHFPKPHPGKGKGFQKANRLNALKWPFVQPKIEILRSNLEKHKTRLILMTQILTYAKMAASEQRNIDDLLEKERQKLEALVIVSHRVKESKYKINPFGLNEVFAPTTKVSVDVVFVHGIFGHPKDTWTCDDTDVFWPGELLPPILEDEGTRILTYGYEAGAEVFADGESRHRVYEVIGNFGRDLASNRQIRKATERPLVFVAHSLGGLIVKGCSTSHEHDLPNLRSISVSTYGVIFLSTPHNLKASHLQSLCEARFNEEACRVSDAIETLKAKYTALQKLNREFLDLAHRYQLHWFRELLEPKILDDISARLSILHTEAICIHTDHYRISKFSSQSSVGFDLVCAAIQNLVTLAPQVIGSRWKEEDVQLRFQHCHPILKSPEIAKDCLPSQHDTNNCHPLGYQQNEPPLYYHHWPSSLPDAQVPISSRSFLYMESMETNNHDMKYETRSINEWIEAPKGESISHCDPLRSIISGLGSVPDEHEASQNQKGKAMDVSPPPSRRCATVSMPKFLDVKVVNSGLANEDLEDILESVDKEVWENTCDVAVEEKAASTPGLGKPYGIEGFKQLRTSRSLSERAKSTQSLDVLRSTTDLEAEVESAVANEEDVEREASTRTPLRILKLDEAAYSLASVAHSPDPGDTKSGSEKLPEASQAAEHRLKPLSISFPFSSCYLPLSKCSEAEVETFVTNEEDTEEAKYKEEAIVALAKGPPRTTAQSYLRGSHINDMSRSLTAGEAVEWLEPTPLHSCLPTFQPPELTSSRLGSEKYNILPTRKRKAAEGSPSLPRRDNKVPMMDAPEIIDLKATKEEKTRAKDEVTVLLAKWTTMWKKPGVEGSLRAVMKIEAG